MFGMTYLIYKVIAVAIAALFIFALLDISRRPAHAFEGVTFSKRIWLMIAIFGTVIFGLEVLNIYLNMGRLLELALIFAAIYYVGPIRDRLGPIDRGGW
ncbi:MAG: DUF2516 family protein [Actinomycetaceae bacterium]|nr:DUF2516 family protein [Actinomycetaceae bacterium]